MASQPSVLEVEDESILSTIFKDAFPGKYSWRDNPDFAHYLAQLSSYGVDKLNREPERIAEERAQILEQTQDLAFHNYKTFIQTAECSHDIFQDFQIIEQNVDSVLDKLPVLSTECKQFMKQAQELNVSRRLNNVTLQRHTQLLEVLEMPQLMDTCVRNGYYEEALEMAAHVKRLEKKHANIQIIQHIVSEVCNSSQLMLTHLIQQLRTNVQLPACLRVIGYLRRMDVFTEAELRMKFLQARDAWFQGILFTIPSDDPYYHITKTIEASRVHLFDIITQYRAIFSDEDPMLSGTRDNGALNDSALFHGWVVQKVSQFIQTLELDLQRGVGGRLDSLLGQCMYFGLSFSRVGADFRGLLAPIFQRAALASFSQALAEANHRLDESMQSYTLLSTSSLIPSSAYNLASQASGALQPPNVLLEYPPIASYCNQLLVAFNDLRLCSPLSLAYDVCHLLQGSLSKAVQVFLAYHRAEESTFDEQEHSKFAELCRVFVEELLPHLNKCLQTLFPPTLIAQTLGVTVTDLSKYGHLGSLNIEMISNPIQHLIPEKEEIVPEEPEKEEEEEEEKEEEEEEEQAEKEEKEEEEEEEQAEKEEKEEEEEEQGEKEKEEEEQGEKEGAKEETGEVGSEKVEEEEGGHQEKERDVAEKDGESEKVEAGGDANEKEEEVEEEIKETDEKEVHEDNSEDEEPKTEEREAKQEEGDE
ncbi:hypothetical protein CAPTEDRAFT_169087 [Capitella teleta]|uniref:Conserved oligomeric Golgi complex subunit 8 n=1 Tax=Capitella teleta TaxID=283909 RepID=R7UL45_CAPTE|nr:hypothetical protein CAPTEDRAFT_169087 [Capitella teleta]|eukprot:ELU07264.1 hypothetical protein CAPTEDRAFT_169087 [Capitella teleta]